MTVPRRPSSASHRPERAGALMRIRRFAVPREMIERATERRLAGDWRGACAAAGIDVRLDPEQARREHGAEFADALLDDLRHLVPDLVRWHHPRQADDRTGVEEHLFPVLSRPGGDRGPWLTVRSPRRRTSRYEGGPWSQRLVLGLTAHEELTLDASPGRTRLYEPQLWSSSRYLWDVRHVHETRERWGGGPDRAPFLNPDGTPRTVAELPTADPGPGDRAARTEWIDHLHQTGRVAEALRAAGVEAADEGTVRVLERIPVSAGRWRAELGGLAALGYGAAAGFPDSYHLRITVRYDGHRVRVAMTPYGGAEPDPALSLPRACWARPEDVDAVRDGLSPDHLHPLLREALAPARPPADGPVGPPPWEPVAPVRARCGKEWHTLSLRDGRLVTPHTGEEQARERALSALGGTVSPCFRAAESWRTGRGWLPKGLHARRAELFERIRHGDTGALVDYLDTGGDPRVRDGELNTLLHELYHLDHTVLLPRLLEAGLDVDAENGLRSTPVHRALRYGGDPSLVRALIAAGARTRAIAYDRSRPLDLRSELESVSGHRVPADPERWRELLEELRGPEGPAAPGRGLPRPRRDP
ncbi:ankyrin repeat domain-containing protein [Nocardiopsis sp. NPDC057823]|uniref:ankyrin repeat domain-containing protein n=1 Tax=Nocardiopsis sp. NPDC057823 TaxID=3346256 RepID=UPI00366BD77F